MWYHDHVLDYTAQNVMRGLAGMFLCFDELDTGDETTGLRLPSGAHDIPLVLQDRRLDAQGQLWYDPLDHNGFLGDLFLVNGAVQPFCNVRARKYRFRLLNGCNARFLGAELRTESGQPVAFDVIANEGGLLSQTLRGQTFLYLSPAKRFDIVVDFSRFAPGTVLYLESRIDHPDGRGPKGTFDRPRFKPNPDRYLKFVVGQPAPDASQVPDTLRPFEPIPAAEISTATRRELRFGRSNGVWVINGESVDLEHPLFTARRGQAEVWTLRNSSGGWWHPIHVHLEFMRVLRRNGRVPGPLERDGNARCDTVILGPIDAVRTPTVIKDFFGKTVCITG
jgi:FtsP/CotA-like multicopper oxidase with cupredoxin domain